MAPVAVVFCAWLLPASDVWDHIQSTLLPRILWNSAVLLVGVLSATAVLGVTLAWLVTMTEFPGRRFLSWALLSPLAVPAYVLGFVYNGMLDFSGPLQTLVRQWGGSWPLPPVRSTWGVIYVMSLALYPYVFLLAKNAFATQGVRAFEAGRSLGARPAEGFFRVALPLARPWILGGLTLVAMETMADFGTVSIFVYDTFTTAIYKAWYGFFSPEAAAQLASLLVVFVFTLLLIQQYLERRKSYAVKSDANSAFRRFHLRGPALWGATGFAWSVFLLAFVLPAIQLLAWTLREGGGNIGAGTLELVRNSLVLATVAAVVITTLALVLSVGMRLFPDPRTKLAGRLATLGYALPGSVLAVGVFLPLVWVDKKVVALVESMTGTTVGLILTGTIFAMVMGLTIRFLAVGVTAVSHGTRRISPQLDEAAATFGVKGLAAVRSLHLPLLRRSLLTAAILVFVDVLKEMPLTLMTRPFGWNTLSVRIYELTSEGQWQRAALPAIVLLLTGMIPVAFLSKGSRDL